MYKRSLSKNGFQYKEPKAKMRRLDISIGSNQQSKETTNVQLVQPSKFVPESKHIFTGSIQPSRETTNAQLALLSNEQPSTSKLVPIIATTTSVNSNNKLVGAQDQQRNVSPTNDLWGDADDECIVIAATQAEKMEIISQQIAMQSMNLSQNNAAKTNKNEADFKIFKDLLNSSQDDDRLFSELPNFDQIGNNSEAMNEYLQNDENSLVNPKTQRINHNQPQSSVFKMPTQRANAILNPLSNKNDPNMSFNPDSRPQSTQFSQRIETPKPFQSIPTASVPQTKDTQVKFLTELQSDLRKENKYIKEENQRLTDECQIKDGESSLLRSENERLQNLYENLRKEKLNENSKIKSEHAAKMSELEKEILSLKSMLQFQEISTKQQQQSRKSISQLNQSCINSSLDAHPWMKFKLLKKTCIPPSEPKPVDSRIFISSNIRSDIPLYDKNQLKYLNDLQRILADMLNQKHITNNRNSQMFDKILQLALLSAIEMRKYTSADEIKSKKKDFTLGHDAISDSKMYSIISDQKICRNEKAFLSRRILICLATICEQFREFAPMLLKYHDENLEENGNFLQLLSRTLESVCYNRYIANYQGFVESSCVFLTSFAANCDIDNPESLSTTANVLHSILLCRPGIRCLEIVSKLLELISYRCRNNNFFDNLCSNEKNQSILEPLAIIKYKSDTCTLQIYALLIRLSILPHMEKKFSTKQLTSITKSTLLFMQNSFLKSSKWTLAEHCGNCLCRGRLFGAIVTLLYVCFLHWIEHTDEIDFQTLSKLAELGVEFFYENLVKNYDSIILCADGPIIKNRIRVIVDWLNFYDFRFKLTHQSALQLICPQRLEPMVEYLPYSKNMTNNNVIESSAIYNDVVDKFFLDISFEASGKKQ